MQVPLVVVDPNTDEVVFGNQAAEKLGVRAGARIGDLVSPDPRARAHYERMQVASPEPRRAYGVPLRVRGEDGEEEERYAIVRSVAVTAPIEALHADERHRLGILFLVEPEADLALLTEDLVGEHPAGRAAQARRPPLPWRRHPDPRARLQPAGAAAARRRARSSSPGSPSTSTAGCAPPPGCSTTGRPSRRCRRTARSRRAQARATIERLAGGLRARRSRDAADLRARLHWDNGVLSAAARPPGAGLHGRRSTGPEDYWFACPVRGGFGFFLGEVLINAIRHGRPGSTPALRIALDRVRRELRCEVENELRGRAARRGDGETYGGKSILRAARPPLRVAGSPVRAAGADAIASPGACR